MNCPGKRYIFVNPLRGWREGGDREGKREREAGREGWARAKPGNQLVIAPKLAATYKRNEEANRQMFSASYRLGSPHGSRVFSQPTEDRNLKTSLLSSSICTSDSCFQWRLAVYHQYMSAVGRGDIQLLIDMYFNVITFYS